ncbi:MAG: serine/threonine-protein kinase, partial [Planctomycetota bacterium]|nr:serine/threonine-protein kinase [Planctomycetota bacterium]
MSSQLAIVTPLKKTPTLLPQSGRLILGSSSDRADMVFQSQGVADVHSVIARTKDGGWAIQDMGSEFGTMVDGKAVQVAKLAGGQTIHLASVAIKVIETAPNQPSTKEPAPTKSRTPETSSPSALSAENSPNPPAKSSRNSILDIPGYSIQETLGKGGMGAVFRARQDRLNRDIALKVLSPRLAADAEFVSRFHREAQAVAALNHPNIVAVYDVGEASGTHYIALEYMDANSLEELLAKEGRLPWRRVAELLLGAARGLTYAESKRIVHRDIKPSNLMLNSDDQVKISDLGLAHRDNDDSGDGKVYGTPHFIAPEQIRGSAVDRRCDIYSLGATGYQLLTGYTPFEGVNSREILRAVLTEDFTPIDSHLSGTPRELSILIEKMISRDPDKRPQSAESVVSNLEGVLSGAASHSAEVSHASSSRTPTSKLAVAALVIAASAAVYHFTVGNTPTVEEEPEATKKSASTVTDEALTTPVSDEVVDGGGRQDPQGIVSTPIEDDTAQKLFESEAEVEFLRMESSDLTLEDQRAKLIQLAEKYNGTTAAAKALAQAQIKGELIKQEKEAAMSLLAHRQAVIEKITLAAALDTVPTFPAKALAAIRAVPGQDRLAQDELFTNSRSLLRDQVCTKA